MAGDINQLLAPLQSFYQQYQQGTLTGPAYQQQVNNLFGDSGNQLSRSLQNSGLDKDSIASALKPYGVSWFGAGQPSVYNVALPSGPPPVTQQQQQLLTQAGQDAQARQASLDKLSQFIPGEVSKVMNFEDPYLADQANASGVLSGTGYGQILQNARAQVTQPLLANLELQGINNTNADIQERQNALNTAIGQQNFDTGVGAALAFGRMSQPQMPQTPSKGSQLLGAAAPAAGSAIGSSFGPIGTAIGGWAGGQMGQSAGGSSKGGGSSAGVIGGGGLNLQGPDYMQPPAGH